MEFEYRDVREFSPGQLQELFLSVNWDSGNHPERLSKAVANSDKVVSVWEGSALVGMATSVSDGFMNAYFPYLLVRPERQGQGLGRELMTRILDYYRDLPRKALIAYEAEASFYERCGFCRGQGKTPMFVTSLRT